MPNQTRTAAAITAEMLELEVNLESARRTGDYFSEACYLDALAEMRRELRKVAN